MRSNLGSVFVAALLTVTGAGATATACSSFTADDALADDSGVPEGGDATVMTPVVDAAAPDLDSGLIALTFGIASCPMFTPCGGDITGTWKLSGGCFNNAIPYSMLVCLGQGGLEASEEKVELRGTLGADGMTLTRSIELRYSVTLAVPEACKVANGEPGTDGGIQGCERVAESLTNSAGTATCQEDPGTRGCTCSYAGVTFDVASVPYTIDASTLTTKESQPRRFAFCVAADRLLRFTETTPLAADTVYSLTPQ